MAEDTKLQTPVLVVGTKEQVNNATIGENDLVTVTDEVFYTAKETDEAIEKTMGDVESVLDKISCEPVEKTKFGVSIDNIFGDIGSDGNYIAPTAKFSVDLAGLTTMPANIFYAKFYLNSGIQKFVANDVISIGTYSFYECCRGAINLTEFCMDNLELVDGLNAFNNCLNGCSKLETISFKSLKRVTGNQSFYGFVTSSLAVQKMDIASIFPALEEITGTQAFNGFVSYNYLSVITFPSLKKITGGSASYNGTFGGIYVANTVWNLPSATELTGYVWNGTVSGEIHFAAANQAAIEACDGYANKWGFAGATIYFDL